jgi:predicted O-linked N-acetylglucosamine transferase (SPINDLY family)
VQPNRAVVHNNRGSALFAEEHVADAIASYQRALELDPNCAEAHLNLGVGYAAEDKTDEASRAYAEAFRLRPEKVLWKMRTVSLCPAVFQSVEELDRYRQELEAQVDQLLAMPFSAHGEDLAADGFTPSFYLSHHGRNNRPLKEKFAALFASCFPNERPVVGQGKPRVGFLATRRHEGGFLRGTSAIIEHLDRSSFQPVVLCSQTVLDRCRRSIRRADVQWIGFPDHLPRAVERIAAAQCDILYHWQIGTDPLNYLLPFARLAPVQCTGWGTHGTSGISAVDYYLSSELIEAEGAEEHYTEML